MKIDPDSLPEVGKTGRIGVVVYCIRFQANAYGSHVGVSARDLGAHLSLKEVRHRNERQDRDDRHDNE